MGGDVRWFDWREHVGSKQIVMETGPLAAPMVDLKLHRQQLFLGVTSLWGGGLATYDGHLQATPPQALGPAYESEAWEEIIDTEWRLGWEEERGSAHLGFMQRDWRRYIEGGAGVSSAEERYRWRLLTVGGEAPLPGSRNWRLALKLGLPLESDQKVYSAKYDTLALEPGDGVFWRVALPYQQDFSEGNLRLELYYQQQDIDASPAVQAAKNGVPQLTQCFGQPCRFYQPASIRRELGLSLLWRFGGSGRNN